MMRGFSPDGTLATALLTVAYLFVVSLSLVACAMPYVLFEQLVGWQPTHLAVITGVLATLPLGPALFAALSAVRDLLDVPGSPGAPFRRFRLAFVSGVRSLWWYWALVAFLTLLMAYNVALAAEPTAVIVAAITLAAVAIALAVALSCAVLSDAPGRPSALLAAAAGTAAAHPHVVLAWLLLVAVAYAAMLIPLVGPSLALFTPATAACGILIVNRAFGFDERMLRHAAVAPTRAS